MSLKKLYVAKCMKDLESGIELTQNIKTKSTNLLVSSADKVFRGAQEKYIDKDEEAAYVQYMHFIELVLLLQKRPDFKKVENCNQLLEQANIAITKAEILKESLRKRYAILEKAAAKENEKNAFLTVIKSGENYGNLSDVSSENIKNEEKLFISSSELYSLITSEKSSIVIMDTRPAKDFEESHIKYHACISVPQEILKPGLTAVKLESDLPKESLSLWFKHTEVDHVILIDWDSENEITLNMCLNILKSAISQNSSLKKTPLIVKGGYKGWMRNYPMLATQVLNLDQLNDSRNSITSDTLDEEKLFISSSELYSLITSEKSSIVIMDTRPAKDFEESHIKYHACISVPQEILKPGLTAVKLESDLPKESLSLWFKHTEVDHVILIDWDSENEITLNMCLNILKSAISQNSSLKKTPLIVKGGYKGWMRNYPMLATQVLNLDQLNDSRNSITSDTLAEEMLSISRSDLYSLIAGQSTIVIDTRPASDFAESQKIYSGCMSIPQEVLKPGKKKSAISVVNLHNGTCGLQNLGNTCYINAALQVLFHTPPLIYYFFNDIYLKDINVLNAYGTECKLANEFADLLKKVWSGKYSYIVPDRFKVIIGEFSSFFQGFQQHDSQELMALVLNTLHWELNRVKDSYYEEFVEPDGQPEEIAKTTWDNFLKRNESIIIDCFYGLLKSTITCEGCQEQSVKFDPFSFLSLPLPLEDRLIKMTLIYSDPLKKPMQMKAKVKALGTIQDLCEAVHRMTQIITSKLIIAIGRHHRLLRILEKYEGIDGIKKYEVFVYEIEPSQDLSVLLPVYWREKKEKKGKVKKSEKKVNKFSYSIFGTPWLLPISTETYTYDQLYNILLKNLIRYFKRSTCNKGKNNRNNTVEKQSTEISNKFGTHSDCENENKFFSLLGVKDNVEYYLKDIEDNVKLDTYASLIIEVDQITKTFINEQEFLDLTSHDSVHIAASRKRDHGVYQLEDCFDIFSSVEHLGPDNLYFCNYCKKHQKITKQITIWNIPIVLIVHLKRFSNAENKPSKLESFIDFPINGLNVSSIIKSPTASSYGQMYDLIGIVNHHGNPSGGHYTAYCKNHISGFWSLFNDEKVTEIRSESIICTMTS